ncbi:MAG TPA: hypothetical protein VGZ31_05435 [Chthoniobacterales bacterium]|jgi:hypothetical protein|nr:hypothetical protein [Chthoniobacterales bacterium]
MTNEALTKIDKGEALVRTINMLVREWRLPAPPASDTDLRKPPSAGLGKNDNQIRALEGPIETNDFHDVDAQVDGDNLVKAKTVADLRDKIWDGIPNEHKIPD